MYIASAAALSRFYNDLFNDTVSLLSGSMLLRLPGIVFLWYSNASLSTALDAS